MTDQAGNSVETADAMSFWINTDEPDVDITLNEGPPFYGALTSGLGIPLNEELHQVMFDWDEFLTDDAFTIAQDITVSFDDVVTNEISLGDLSSRSRVDRDGTNQPLGEAYRSDLTISSAAEKQNIVIRVPKKSHS